MNRTPFTFSFLPQNKGVTTDLQSKNHMKTLMFFQPNTSAEQIISFYGFIIEQQGGESIYEHDDLASVQFNHIV